MTVTTLKQVAENHRRMMALKVSQKEKRLMQERAKHYCEGNLSEWIRYAALNHRPLESELVGSKTSDVAITKLQNELAICRAEQDQSDALVVQTLRKILNDGSLDAPAKVWKIREAFGV